MKICGHCGWRGWARRCPACGYRTRSIVWNWLAVLAIIMAIGVIIFGPGLVLAWWLW